MKRTAALLPILFLIGCDHPSAPATAPSSAEPQPQSLPTTELKIGTRTFTLQVAASDATRETGLMYVHAMAADRGMIFLFPSERVLEFWMHNTPIDLDIIYVDHHDRVTAMKTMHAYDESSISSEDPADVAIELNAGIGGQTGLSVGDTLSIPAGLRAQAR